MNTKIGSKTVPVRMGRGPTVVRFSAGLHGVKERGDYKFWTAILSTGAKRRIFGRARTHLSAGARFDRIGKERFSAKTRADRRVYAQLWKALQSVSYVRPANAKEVKRWMDGHATDAVYASQITINGKHHSVKAQFEFHRKR